MESLMQRVENITEELKAKDILLARAEVEARGTEKPTEQFSQNSSGQPPTHSQENHLSSKVGYLLQDDDVYMGDNEADKLREERRIKKDMRKRKVNARQVEDEDERMDNNHISDSDMAAHKGIDESDKRKRKEKTRQVEDEDERMDNNHISDSNMAAHKGIDESDNRKGKGKTRQVEDEDERMDNNYISESDMAARKGIHERISAKKKERMRECRIVTTAVNWT
jgi:hypothetical protein